MGLYDRDYTQADSRFRFYEPPQMRMVPQQITPVVKKLLIINVAVFVASFMIEPISDFFFTWFSVHPKNLSTSFQVWRLGTYQFLHGGFWHIFGNMLVLFFFGPVLERLWGGKKFLIFYLVCGAMGGVLYSLLALANWLDVGILVGASGAILGVLAAAAIMFPMARVYIWGIFPIRLMVLAIILALISIMTLLRPDKFTNAGGQAAHLAGMATGALYVLSGHWRDKLRFKIKTKQSGRKIAEQQNLHNDVDRILKKVHDSGIHSLTLKEKRALQKATKDQQVQNRF